MHQLIKNCLSENEKIINCKHGIIFLPKIADHPLTFPRHYRNRYFWYSGCIF